MGGERVDDVRVEVRLADDRTRYSAGEVVRGEVVVTSPRPRRCDYVRVRLWWGVYGEQDRTDHVDTEDEVVFVRSGELCGEHRWSFAVTIPPVGPTTSNGDTVWVTYSVTARVQWVDEEKPLLHRIKLQVEPTALPSSGERTERPVWACADMDALRRRIGEAGAEDVSAALDALKSAGGSATIERWRDRFRDAGAWLVVAVIVLGGVGITLAMVFGLAAWVFEPGFILRKVIAAVVVGLLGWGLWDPAREQLRRLRDRFYYGGVDIDFLSPPRYAAVGESPEFRVRIRRRPRRPVERVVWELRIRQEAASIVKRTRRGSTYETTTWKHETHWVDKQTLDAPKEAEAILDIRPTIPRGKTASVHRKYRRIVWEMRVWVYSRDKRFTEGKDLHVLPLRVLEEGEALAAAPEAAPVPETGGTAPAPTPEPAPALSPEVAPLVEEPPAAVAEAASGGFTEPAAGGLAEPMEALRRRAAFAISRLRAARRAELRSWTDRLLVTLFVLYPIGLTFAIFAIPEDTMPPLAIYVPLILIAAVGVMDLFLLAPVVGSVALFHVLKAALFAPWRGLRLLAERRVERWLLQKGRVPRTWFSAGLIRRAAVDRLVSLEPDLVLDDEGLRLLSTGPPEGCPTCGAALTHPGPGLRRCVHCEFERYDPPPARSTALSAADQSLRRLSSATGDLAQAADTAAAFRAFRQRKSPNLGSITKWSLIGCGAMLLCTIGAQIAGIERGVKPEGAALAFFSIGVVLGFFGAIGLAWAAYRWLKLRFVEFRPGVLAHDLAMREEILRVVAHQGQIGLDDLAVHLGVSRARLDGLVGRMAARRRLPVYHDREHDRLVTVFAGKVGDSRCPSCGGRLGVAAGTRLECTYCEAEVEAVLA